MDVFTAFPKAITTDWKIGSIQRATEVGDVYSEYGSLTAIASVGSSAKYNTAPDPQTADSTALLYVKPSTLPTTDTNALKASYVVQDGLGLYYDIVDASEGFNQETGTLEHIELSLKLTEVAG